MYSFKKIEGKIGFYQEEKLLVEEVPNEIEAREIVGNYLTVSYNQELHMFVNPAWPNDYILDKLEKFRKLLAKQKVIKRQLATERKDLMDQFCVLHYGLEIFPKEMQKAILECTVLDCDSRWGDLAQLLKIFHSKINN